MRYRHQCVTEYLTNSDRSYRQSLPKAVETGGPFPGWESQESARLYRPQVPPPGPRVLRVYPALLASCPTQCFSHIFKLTLTVAKTRGCECQAH